MQPEQFKTQAVLGRASEMIAQELERGADLLLRAQMLTQRVEELEAQVKELQERQESAKSAPDAEPAEWPDFD